MSNTSSEIDSDASEMYMDTNYKGEEDGESEYGDHSDDDTKEEWWTVPDRRYSHYEVQEAYEWVKKWKIEHDRVRRGCECDSLTTKPDTFDFSNRWSVMHILTSDDAWASVGQRSVEDDKRKDVDVRTFFRSTRDGIEGGERAVSFMKANIHNGMENFFVRLLRACLLRFPDKLELYTTSSFDKSDGLKLGLQGLKLGPETLYYTALQLAVSSDRYHNRVVETLLQAGAEVDKATTHGDIGDTPLMLAIACGGYTIFPEKVDILLDYGADITTFNWYFENALHIAVFNDNVRGLRTILDVYKQRLGTAPDTTSASWRKTGASQRLMDMLHLPMRSFGDTPLSIAAGPRGQDDVGSFGCKTRLEMIELIVNAGANANNNTVIPAAYGWIQYDADEDTINITICHGTYNAHIQLDIDMLLEFYDHVESTRKPEFIDAENCSEEDRFVCDVFKRLSVDGGQFSFISANPTCGPDFDIHFSVQGDLRWTPYNGIANMHKPKVTLYGPDDPRADHKIAIRFPPGPWTDGYDWRANVSVGYDTHSRQTLAHHAASSASYEDKDTWVRSLVYSTARSLCNPLLKCDGLTAVELFRKQIASGTIPSDLESNNMLVLMQNDFEDIMTFIRKDCPVCSSARRERTQRSRFDELPDDVVEKILSFM